MFLVKGYGIFTNESNFVKFYRKMFHREIRIIHVKDPRKFNVTEYRRKTRYNGTLIVLQKNDPNVLRRLILEVDIGEIINGTYTINIVKIDGVNVYVKVRLNILMKSFSPKNRGKIIKLVKSAVFIINAITRDVLLTNGTCIGKVSWWISLVRQNSKVVFSRSIMGIVRNYWFSPVSTKLGRLNVWELDVYSVNDEYFKFPSMKSLIGRYLYEVASGLLITVIHGFYYDPMINYLTGARAISVSMKGSCFVLDYIGGYEFKKSIALNVYETFIVFFSVIASLVLLDRIILLKQ